MKKSIFTFLTLSNEPLSTVSIAILYAASIWGTQEFYHRKTADFILSRFPLTFAIVIQSFATLFCFSLCSS